VVISLVTAIVRRELRLEPRRRLSDVVKSRVLVHSRQEFTTNFRAKTHHELGPKFEIVIVPTLRVPLVDDPVSVRIRDELAKHVIVFPKPVRVLGHPLVPTLYHCGKLDNEQPEPLLPSHPTVDHQLFRDDTVVSTPLLPGRRHNLASGRVDLRLEYVSGGSLGVYH